MRHRWHIRREEIFNNFNIWMTSMNWIDSKEVETREFDMSTVIVNSEICRILCKIQGSLKSILLSNWTTNIWTLTRGNDRIRPLYHFNSLVSSSFSASSKNSHRFPSCCRCCAITTQKWHLAKMWSWPKRERIKWAYWSKQQFQVH